MKGSGASEDESCRTRGAPEESGRRARRTPRVVVMNPRITVVEGPDTADPAALDAALELLVKWAVRAHKRGHPAASEAPTDQSSATYGPEK